MKKLIILASVFGGLFVSQANAGGLCTYNEIREIASRFDDSDAEYQLFRLRTEIDGGYHKRPSEIEEIARLEDEVALKTFRDLHLKCNVNMLESRRK